MNIKFINWTGGSARGHFWRPRLKRCGIDFDRARVNSILGKRGIKTPMCGPFGTHHLSFIILFSHRSGSYTEISHTCMIVWKQKVLFFQRSWWCLSSRRSYSLTLWQSASCVQVMKKIAVTLSLGVSLLRWSRLCTRSHGWILLQRRLIGINSTRDKI